MMEEKILIFTSVMLLHTTLWIWAKIGPEILAPNFLCVLLTFLSEYTQVYSSIKYHLVFWLAKKLHAFASRTTATNKLISSEYLADGFPSFEECL